MKGEMTFKDIFNISFGCYSIQRIKGFCAILIENISRNTSGKYLKFGNY